MIWQSPDWLIALVVLVPLATMLVAWVRDRRRAAREYADPRLIDVAPSRGLRRRRALAGALALLAVACGPVALARPSLDRTGTEKRGALMLAIDTSLTMLKRDIQPTRLAAAADAASRLLDLAPKQTAIGLLVFDRGARVLVAPTLDRQAVRRVLHDLGVHEGTTIGEAVVAGLNALASGGFLSPLPPTPEEAAGRILLLTDGAHNLGIEPSVAGERAKADRVPVYTILIGHDPGFPGQPPPAEAMAALANQTGGTFTQTATATDLRHAVEDINGVLVPVRRLEQLTVWLALLAVVLLAIAGALLLSGRAGTSSSRARGQTAS